MVVSLLMLSTQLALSERLYHEVGEERLELYIKLFFHIATKLEMYPG
jgi:hypothetical protein